MTSHHRSSRTPRTSHSRVVGSHVDGFTRARSQAQYKRRAEGIIPATESEYMSLLGARGQAEHAEKLAKPRRTKKLRKIYLNNSFKKIATGVVVIAAVSFGVLGVLHMQRDSGIVADADLRNVLEDNGDTPHDKAPYNLSEYQVAPEHPRLLTIQKLGIEARVTRLEARQNSIPKSPKNIHDVGWYENSAKPGEYGATLLIGHLRGSEKNGVFYDLTRLTPGDEFQLETGDGTIRQYQVIKMKAYDRNEVDYQELSASAADSQPGLNLLTAVGTFKSNELTTQQLAVFAVETSLE